MYLLVGTPGPAHKAGFLILYEEKELLTEAFDMSFFLISNTETFQVILVKVYNTC